MTPQQRTPLLKGQIRWSQWCLLYKGYTIHIHVIIIYKPDAPLVAMNQEIQQQ